MAELGEAVVLAAEPILLEAARRLNPLAALLVFVGFPLLGSEIWSLYGCNGKISDVLCL